MRHTPCTSVQNPPCVALTKKASVEATVVKVEKKMKTYSLGAYGTSKLYLLRSMFSIVALFLIVVVPYGTTEAINRTGEHAFAEATVFARSVENRPIRMFDIGSGPNVTLLIGGIHGDEPLTVQLLGRLVEDIKVTRMQDKNKRIVIVPLLNPDGFSRRTRTNANGTDINRNFPTDDWRSSYSSKRHNPGKYPASEPETRAVIDLCKKIKPCKIVALHSPMKLVNYDGPAESLARLMAQANGYPVKNYIGYKTPGSIGTFYGKERKIPVITLELASSRSDVAWKDNKDALRASIDYIQEGCGDVRDVPD